MSILQSFITNETAQKLSARTYALANIPLTGTQSVFLNGILQNASATTDYTISDNIITFNFDVDSSDTVIVNYMIEPPQPPEEDQINPLSSRKKLIHWCLRRLGAPVIDVNLADEQIEDRIDEALLYFRDYHFDGIQRTYLHHKITASTMILQSALSSNPPEPRARMLGNTSGAAAVFYDKNSDGTVLRFYTTNGKCFIPGETVSIAGIQNPITILNSNTAITLGDVDTKQIHVGTKAISITNIIPQESSTIGGNLGGMFDFQYQFALNNMFNLASTDLVTYDVYKRYISMWEFMFRGKKGLSFNRKTDRVYVDIDATMIDKWVIFEAWVALNPQTYTEIYSDEFVREYAYNLLKLQWGSNLKKYSGISLPGGTTLNGQQIYDEAKTELDVLRERVRKEFEFPPDFMVG
ncbi:hypothetical protein UFOVP410_4 [uncultured Caudovirales phage]|uniref:Neck protein n=1 Tax=uncultured Caudovirales phage TaxID=2100421 RepID=A0A6J5M2L2_9CAUD|nr:hypothetical protein UFOVP410_4 [uncultured Caudovirales phage]